VLPSRGREYTRAETRAAVRIIAKLGARNGRLQDGAALGAMRQRLARRRLIPSRLNLVRQYALAEARNAYQPWARPQPKSTDRKEGANCTVGEWVRASWLVARAALSLMADVDLLAATDASGLLDAMMSMPATLPSAQRRKIKRVMCNLIDGVVISGHAFKPTGKYVRLFAEGSR
jgi:hypothetical protein